MSRLIAAFTQFFDDAGDPLINGWLEFLESGSTGTKKDTYADSLFQVENSNPLQLDAAGRCPNVFGIGSYRVISYTRNVEDEEDLGSMVQLFDPVDAPSSSSSGGGAGLIAWSSTSTYSIGDIVTYNQSVYRAIQNITSISPPNSPPTVETASWEEIEFLQAYNENVNYSVYDVCHYEGNIYISLSSLNQNHQPDESPSYWKRFGNSTYKTAIKTTDYEILTSERDYLFILGSAASAASQFDLPLVDATNDLFRVSIYNASNYDLTITALGGLDVWIDTSGDIALSKGSHIELIYIHSLTAWVPLHNVGPILGNQDLGTSTSPIPNLYASILHGTVIPTNDVVYFGSGGESLIGYASSTLKIGTVASAVIDIYTNDTLKWRIDTGGNIFPVSAGVYNLGGASNEIKNIYQGDSCKHYFGADQDAYIEHSGTGFSIQNLTGAITINTQTASGIYFAINTTNRWWLNPSGYLIPVADNTYDIGDSSHKVNNIWLNGPPDNDEKAANKAYVDYRNGTFVSNANSNPNLSDTTFAFFPDVSENSWESIGPTGSGADNIWSALDDVPSDADWIEVHCESYYGEQSTTGAAYLYASARGYGGAGSGIRIARINTYGSLSGSITEARGAQLVVVKIPIDSEVRFEIYWTEDKIDAYTDIVTLTLVGYGYNK